MPGAVVCNGYAGSKGCPCTFSGVSCIAQEPLLCDNWDTLALSVNVPQ